MSFKKLKIKHSYNSEKDDILSDFYIPVLAEAMDYKRVAGYFSSSSFYLAASGLSKFIVNGGHMQLIINIQLSAEDYEQIRKSIKDPDEIIEQIILEDLEEIKDACVKDHVAVLGWMIANGYLEIKVGYIKEPVTAHDILHQKVGIMKDRDGNVITFSGSNNESASGWLFNSEKFKVFCDWESGAQDYVQQDIQDFLDLWNNTSSKTGVIPFPEAIKKNLIAIAPKNEMELKALLKEVENHQKAKNKPRIALRGYQNEAVQKWADNNYKGLFEMATGTGKTYTAVGAMKEILEKEPELVTVISCPFLHLIPQWEKSLLNSGVDLPKIFASSTDPKWREKLQSKLLDIKLKRLKQLLILTTHDTAASEDFKALIQEIRIPLMLIGDEVHGMGSTNRIEGLLTEYKYRLGLSATPARYFDDKGTQELLNYFDKIVFTFDLRRAISEIDPTTGQSYLAPYEYYPIFVDLNIQEFDKYIKLTKEIARLHSRERRTKQEETFIEFKLRERADIIKNAESKYAAFAALLKNLKEKDQLKHTLVYCSPQQIRTAQEIIQNEKRIIQHKFTSEEDATKKDPKYGGRTEREYLLHNFDEGVFDVLVAIKCLDEGVDVPSTKTAILMCSTGNPKEYIQRRGRVLRRFPGKDKAVIYDFIIIPDLGDEEMFDEYESKIVQSQFQRIEEFVDDSLNGSEISRELFKIKLKYKIIGGAAHVR